MPSALSNAKYGCGFRNRLDDGRHRLHGSLTPLRLSQIVLIALRRFTARQDRFTLGLRLDESSFSCVKCETTSRSICRLCRR